MPIDYKVKVGGVCIGCGYRSDSIEHFRLHVPRNQWPAEFQVKRKPRVVVDGLVYDEDRAPASRLVQGAVLAARGAQMEEVVETQTEGLAFTNPGAYARFTCDVCLKEAKSAAGLAAHKRSHKQAANG